MFSKCLSIIREGKTKSQRLAEIRTQAKEPLLAVLVAMVIRGEVDARKAIVEASRKNAMQRCMLNDGESIWFEMIGGMGREFKKDYVNLM